MRYLLLSACTAALALLFVGGAAAGSSYTLHPAGFGTKSYSAWKAHQGTPDDRGGADQALYFQKMTSTATFSAGVAVINGVEGTPLDQLTGLSWWHREDGHCGAGAPRWNVDVQDNTTGQQYTTFLGCYAAQHTETGVTTNGVGWCQDAQPSPASAVAAQAGTSASNLTITGLAIVFDEGTDTPNPPPAPCAQTNTAAGGFVYLDNIDVQINNVDHCWTNASDNGNAPAAACDPPAGTSVTGSTVSTGLPTGIALDPTNLALVHGLSLAEPNVLPAAWLLYPNVIY